VYAIDAVTGRERWRFKTGNWVDSSPAVSNGIVYVGGTDKNLYAMDAVTGTEKWRFKTGSYIQSSLGVSNDILYVGNADNNLYGVGMPSTQTTVSTQPVANNPAAQTAHTTVPTRTLTLNPEADPIGISSPLWDRNNLIYLILLVFVFLFGALVYDMYYKKKK
jgi:hypothetical protein